MKPFYFVYALDDDDTQPTLESAIKFADECLQDIPIREEGMFILVPVAYVTYQRKVEKLKKPEALL